MADRYYNLEMSGDVVKGRLESVSNKLDKIGGIATNLKLDSESKITENTHVTNKEYVDTTISNYSTLEAGILTIGNNTINLNNTYLHSTDTKKIQLSDNSQLSFGTAGQMLISNGDNQAPQWVDQRELTIILSNDDSDDDFLNGISSITTDALDSHKLIVTKDSFVRNIDIDNLGSPLGSALDKKVNIEDLQGDRTLIIGQLYTKPFLLPLGTIGQVLKISPDEQNPDILKINWADEKSLDLTIVDNEASRQVPEDAINIVSRLSYEDPTLTVYRGQAVDYTAYKVFEAAVDASLLNKATKDELSHKADKTELGDQFTMEFDSETGTLLITKK